MTTKMKLMTIPKVMVPTVTLVNNNQRQKKKKKKNKRKGPNQLGKLFGPSGALNRRPIRDSLGSENSVVSNTNSIPIAFDTVQGNTTFVSAPRGVLHPREGIEGIQLHGCQPLSDIAGGGDGSIFTTATLATVLAGGFKIQLNPDSLNGPLAAHANLFNRFVFRDILIEYISSVATTQAGVFALSIDADGDNTSAPQTFATCRQVVPNIVIPFRHDKAYLHFHYNGDELFYNLIDNTNSATNRQTSQGTLSGVASSAIAVAALGFTNIWYVVDLYNPVQSQGFTVTVTRAERDLVNRYLSDLRRQTLQNTEPMPSTSPSSSSSTSHSNFPSYEMVSRGLTPQIPNRK